LAAAVKIRRAPAYNNNGGHPTPRLKWRTHRAYEGGWNMLNEIGLTYGTDKSSLKHNYLVHYEKILAPWREQPFIMIEIGGFRGASLKMWREYFTNALILCFDIDPAVRAFAEDRIHVHIGDASDATFLNAALDQYDTPSFILDDGSHRWDHQIASFEMLFPRLAPGGLYIVEDTHTSFEPNYAGDSVFTVVEYMHKYIEFLQLRGPALAYRQQLMPARILEIAQTVESVTAMRRAMLIRKV